MKTFSISEIRDFGYFLNTPLHCTHVKLRQLYAALLPYAPDFEIEKTKENLYTELYGSGFSNARMNNLMSDLLQQAYRFLVWQQQEKDVPARQIALNEALLERNMKDHLPRTLRRLNQVLSSEEQTTTSLYWHEYIYLGQVDRYELQLQRRTATEYLQQRRSALDRFYQLEKLRIACDMLSRSRAVNASYELLDLSIPADELADDPVLKVYYATYRLLLEPEEKTHFSGCKDLYERFGKLFAVSELRTLYSYLLNHCVRMINEGKTSFYQEVFDLYKLLLEKEIIMHNGYLTQWTYTNIITSGIRLKAYDWTEKFIILYKERLPAAVRENVYTYNLASLFFEKGKLSEALQQLQRVEFTDAFYQGAAKMMQLKIYFLLDETEAFFSLVLATRRFLERNSQLSSYQKKAHLRFVQLLNRLYKIHSFPYRKGKDHYRQQLAKLEEQVRHAETLAYRDWLLSIIRRLNGDNRDDSFAPA